jgi:hypothetical protein
MHGMQPRIGYGTGAGALARVLLAAAGLAVAAIDGGCTSSIQTPLPDMIRPPANTSLSDKERKEAVDELAKKRDTHEQDAQQQIEQSR